MVRLLQSLKRKRRVGESSLTLQALISYGRRPSGRNSSLTLLVAISGAVPALQTGIFFLFSSYSVSIGSQTASTRSVKRSPISRSVTVFLRCR